MRRKQITSLLLSSILALSAMATPFTQLPVYAAEAESEVIESEEAGADAESDKSDTDASDAGAGEANEGSQSEGTQPDESGESSGGNSENGNSGTTDGETVADTGEDEDSGEVSGDDNTGENIEAADDEETVEDSEDEDGTVVDEEAAAGETKDEADGDFIFGGVVSATTEGQETVPEENGGESPDDLFADYVEKSFNGELSKTPSLKKRGAKSAGSNLSGIDRAIYNNISACLPQIAAGERASTVFEISVDELGLEKTAWTAEELGIDGIIVEGEFTQAALDAVEEKCSFDLTKVINALMSDYPYHLYWYEKNAGTSASGYDIVASYDDMKEEYLIAVSGKISISMAVADEFSAGEYIVDTSVGQSVQDAVTNAGNIVEQYSGATDYEKLVGYKDEICSLVSYNNEAANGTDSYGNPWQMIWVFDGNPETNVVCEGYSKAFKCLCDMSDFTADIETIMVTGTMIGGTGEGPHMWNVVKMEDKKNYLVDVTNCDEGTVGEPDQLFLAGTSEKLKENDIVTGYTFIIGDESISYQYDQDTLTLYENLNLDISLNSYVADKDAPESLNSLISELPSIEESSIHHYYYNQLTDVQKALYWKLIDCIEDSSFNLYVQLDEKTIDTNELVELLAVIQAENPMLTGYFDASSFSYSFSDNGVLSITLQKSQYSSYQIESALAKKNQILETVGDGDRFTQIVNLLTYINRNIIYDYDGAYFNGGTNSRHPHDIMGALLYDACVCEGFSIFIKAICDEKGIPCLVVEGDDSSNPNENHVWNIIQMEDDQWYLVDGTRICKGACEEDTIIEYVLKGKDFVSEYTIYGGVNSIGISVPGNGDISVPSIAEKGYEYQGTYDHSNYHEGDVIIDESHQFSYRINKDLITCTVTGYEGIQQGDLIIPDYLDGYRVTAIANNAFYMNRGFTGNLVVPDTVTDIGNGAFYHCDGLTGTLTLSQNLTRIGRIAFMDCTNLSGGIDLPESLLQLGECAFFRCKHLTGDVYVPKNITSVFNIFSQCYGISSFTVSRDNPTLCSYQGVIYSKDRTQLLLCPPSISELNIPDSVIVIGQNACYDCPGLENSEIVLPSNLQRIEDHAFQDTNLVGDIIIPNSVTYIGYGAFIRSFNENVSGRRLVLPNNLEYLGAHAFWNCGLSGEVYLPSSINEIGDLIFSGNQITLTCDCDNTVITEWYKNGSDHYVDQNSLYLLHGNQQNRSETLVNGTEGVVSVEYDCSVCNKHISELETDAETLYRGGINGCDITWKIDTDGHLLLSGRGYMNPDMRNLSGLIPTEGKESVTEVVIQNGIENVGSSLCSGLSSLISINLPSSVTEICYSAFSGCSGLQEIRIPSHIKTIREMAFSDCTGVSSLILEDGVESIGYAAFYNCPAVESVYIPDSVKDIESSAFGFLLIKDGDDSYFAINEQFIIQGITGSEANEYAQQNNMRFIPLDEHLDHIEDKGIPLLIVEEREATCSEEGLTEGVICETCGKAVIKQEVIPKLEHTWGNLVTDLLPTCTEEGSESIHCKVCDAINENSVNVIPATGHKWNDNYTIDKEATCAEEGSESIHCSVCGVSDENSVQVIPATGHAYGEWIVTKEATCTEAGSREKSCASCGDKVTEEIPATSHAYGEWTVTKEATCTEAGSKEKVCASCGDKITEEIPATDHSYGDWTVTKEATCTENGSREKVCANCGDKVTEEIIAIGHLWDADYTIDKEATCIEDGAQSIHCSVCGESDESSVGIIPATGHAYGDWTVTKEATCTEVGSKEKVCASCGDKVTEEIPATGHSYGEWTVTKEATCTEAGSREKVCANCGDKVTEEILAIGHLWDSEYTVDKEATCTEEGSESIHCSVCGVIDENSVQAIPKKEHTYGDWTVTKEATCTEAGSKEKVCANCEDKITEEIPATGHAWSEWTVVREATEEEEGLERRTCSNDPSHTEERTIPKLSHVHELIKTEAKEASCTEDGNIEFWTCSKCGRVYSDSEGVNEINPEETVIHAAGHKWNTEYTVDKEATCTEEGSESLHCSVCGVSDENSVQVVPATGHAYGDWTVVREATCTEAGSREKACANCGDKITEEIPAKGHQWNNSYTVDVAPTYTEEGVESIHCSVCDEIQEGSARAVAKLRKPVSMLEISGIVDKNYNGKAQTQAVVVMDGDTTLVNGTDYTVSYENNINAGTASVIITGIGSYSGYVTKEFKIKKIANTITAKSFTRTYSTKGQSFGLGVKVKSGTPTYKSSSKSVTVSKAGKVTVKAKFMGKVTIKITAPASANYTATTKKITITVNPTKTALVSVTSPSAGKMAVKWKKNAVGTGYQIQYSTSSKFTSPKLVTITKNSTLTRTIGSLAKGKKYYVRIRTYKTVGGTKFYSGWSAAKAVTVKK